MKDKSNPRKAAYLALMASAREECFIADSLNRWKQETNPSSLDFHFAQKLASGTTQMAMALDYLAIQLTAKNKLSLKLKEKLLLRLALYQFYFLERIPIYAIADEMIELAKKYCHHTFANFLNAILRKLPEKASLNLPDGDSIKDLSIRYSYPDYFVEQLSQNYDINQVKEVLAAGNHPAPLMTRIRGDLPSHLIAGLRLISEDPFAMAIIEDPSLLNTISSSSNYYIQNIAPASLIGSLAQATKAPKRILDLCASPGGKLLALHDLFPKAKLHGNDISDDKVNRLEENCRKYNINAQLTEMRGELFSSKTPFDLIVLDVPCSNSGVLNKRPEARWRLSKDQAAQLKTTQMQLLNHATTLLAPEGELWYMTCSILRNENEDLVAEFCQSSGFTMRKQQLFLPNSEGWDGGYACALTK